MTNLDDVLVWIEYAEEDFADARAALRAKNPRIKSACYHSQQCAEKYLKALLISKSVEFPRTHHLPVLDVLCNQNGILTGFAPKALIDLSGLAISARYPGDEPTPDDAREAIAIAKTIRKFSRKWLGIK